MTPARRAALITGGTRRIGRAVALALARDGMHVAVLSRRRDEDADRTVADLLACGVDALHLAADVTDEVAVRDSFAAAAARFGAVDTVIHCAGLRSHTALESMSLAHWRDVMATNLDAAFLCSRAALRVMKPRQRGRILNIGSISAQMPRVHSVPYTTSKFGLEGMTRALALEATPARRLGLGYTRYTQGDLEEGRAAFTQAMVEFVAQGDDRGAAQARLALADSYLASGQGDLIIQWAKVVLQELDPLADPEAIARAHLLLSAADLLIGRSLSEAERHLIEATQLAGEYHLPAIAAQGQFALGNVLAERGDYEEAVQVFAQSIVLAQAAGNLALEVYGHNNLAYHALLAHDLDTAQAQIESGMALAQKHALFIPWQYLYSTRGEIALAQGQLDEAETFFHRALSEAEKHGNQLQVANIGANLSRVARERGDSDGALILLTEASRAVREQPALHLHTQIDLWLAELYIQRGERAAAKDAWQQAERRLKGSGRHGLAAWATRIEAALQG